MENKEKVFNLGLSRTGTLSLHNALTILGYNDKHYPNFLNCWRDKKYRRAEIKRFDSLTDTPVLMYRHELSKMYPNAKYIVTIRDKKEWIVSCRKFFSHYPSNSSRIRRSRVKLYGSIIPSRRELSKAYNRWNKRIFKFVSNRDHVILNICKDEDLWQKLCEFLGDPIPSVPFPWSNRAK